MGRKMSLYGSFGIKIVVVNEGRRTLLPQPFSSSALTHRFCNCKHDNGPPIPCSNLVGLWLFKTWMSNDRKAFLANTSKTSSKLGRPV